MPTIVYIATTKITQPQCFLYIKLSVRIGVSSGMEKSLPESFAYLRIPYVIKKVQIFALMRSSASFALSSENLISSQKCGISPKIHNFMVITAEKCTEYAKIP